MGNKNKSNGKWSLHQDVVLIAKAAVAVVVFAWLSDQFDAWVRADARIKQECVNGKSSDKIDTLYVLGNNRRDNHKLYVQRPNGTKGDVVVNGVKDVDVGDTIVVNSVHRFLVDNITKKNSGR